jgi:hypothetical protein
LVFGVAASAGAGDTTLENRPDVVFPGLKKGNQRGIVHVSPYPAGKRSTSVWVSDACWHDCTASCSWKMEECVGTRSADVCRPHLTACDRSCQLSCRSRGGSYVGFLEGLFDW